MTYEYCGSREAVFLQMQVVHLTVVQLSPFF